MLDIKLIRENVEEVIQRLQTRGGDFSYLREVTKMDIRKREILVEMEALKNERNLKSKQVGELKRQKQDATDVLESVSNIGEAIKQYEEELNKLEEKIINALLITPNIVNKNVKIGKSESDNLVVRTYLEPTKLAFDVKDHYELGENLDILDFGRAAKITGSRFVVYKGLGARLERALISFMIDTHTFEKKYTEIIPPYIVNKTSMIGTGQFPKFADDAYRVVSGNNDEDWYLNPTAEVPTINMYRDEILEGALLPLRYVSFTTAFRAEAGSAGRDTKGILRQHQFNKVELIKFTKPEDSAQELLEMLECSENILKLLEIPYRVVELCTGDIGFAMATTYDIEVWIPSQGVYREIASISNAEDYQARRANIRFKRNKDAKTEYVHTLNGSGLAIGRTVIAIMENYQQVDGSIRIPEVLKPYMRVDCIKKQN